jgi:hypothetical protein
MTHEDENRKMPKIERPFASRVTLEVRARLRTCTSEDVFRVECRALTVWNDFAPLASMHLLGQGPTLL